MRFVLTIACLLGCGPAVPDGPRAPSSRLNYPLREHGVERLVTATRAHDAAAIQAMFAPDLVFGGAWFADAACRSDFTMAGPIAADKRSALARCLAALPLSPATRTSMHSDVALVTYAPGIELEVLFGGSVEQPTLRWLGYVSRVGVDDSLPTITQDAFEALRSARAEITLDDGTRQKIDAELADVTFQNKPVFTYFKVCIDAQGNVADVRARMTSSLVAQFAYEQQLQAWKLRPFLLGGVAAPVCSLLRIGTAPADRDSGAVPTGVPEAHANTLHVMPWMLESRRTEGSKAIFPADEDKERIQDSKVTAILGVVHFCIDAKGTVRSTTIVRSTGFPGYDRALLEGARRWRYRPLEIDGAPVPACSFVTFLYSQR